MSRGAGRGRVEWRPDRCLRVGWPEECARCVGACPAVALGFDHDEQVAVGVECDGCGRCAATCPTGALRIPGWPAPRDLSVDKRSVLRLECSRVAAPRDAEVVACLHGLSASWLLDAAARPDVDAVEVVDRGWCATCPDGRGNGSRVEAAVDRATLLMRAAGVVRASPKVVRVEGAVRRDDERSRRLRGRRRLLAALIPPPAADPDDGLGVRARRVAEARALSALAGRAGAPLPPAFYAEATIDERCVDHRVCASACPAGALAAWDDGARRGLDFDPVRCIACGRCERTCPTGAIRVRPSSERADAERVHRLSNHGIAICAECDDEFVATDGADRCPACRKARALFASESNPVTGRSPVASLLAPESSP